MDLHLYLGLVFILDVYLTKGACPNHCKAGQICDTADSGCSDCVQTYYGRTCQHRTECRFSEKGVEYRGTQNVTISGRTCQRWDSQTPHRHTPKSEEKNYCRNPDGEVMPWCYTTDPSTRFEFCNISLCNTQCLPPALDVPYVDIINPPSDGFAVGFNATLGCTVGDENHVYTTCQSDKTWSSVKLPNCTVNKGACPSHCKAGQLCKAEDSGCSDCQRAYYGRKCQHRTECGFTVKGVEYRGTQNMTINGRTCQRWDSQTPHRHTPKSEEENYCRNPDNADRPWCYTTDPSTRFEFCNISLCNTQCLSPALDAPYFDIINPPSGGFAVGFNATLGCTVGDENRVYTTCQSDKTWSPVKLPNCTVNKGACPSHCKAGQLCNAEDFGCSYCERAYYGRKCQHRMECRFTEKGAEYRGTQNVTISGRTCQRWDSQSPHRHTPKSEEENYCRNSDNADRPWCYTTDPSTRFEFCNISLCNTQCLSLELDAPYVDIINPPSSGFAVGFIAILGCIVGNSNYVRTTCQNDKSWSSVNLPNCEENKAAPCSIPALPRNTVLASPQNSYVYKDQVNLTCVNGFELQDRSTITCLANGTWGTIPECTAVKCVDLYPTSNLLKWNPKKREFYYKDKVTFECKGGYNLSHSNSLECQADKMWDNEIKSCIANTDKKIFNRGRKMEMNTTEYEVCDGLTTAQWIGITSGFIVITAIVTAIVSVIATYRILHKKTTKDTIPSNLVNNEAFNYEAIDVSMRVVEEPHVYNIPQETSFTNIQDDNGQNYQNN